MPDFDPVRRGAGALVISRGAGAAGRTGTRSYMTEVLSNKLTVVSSGFRSLNELLRFLRGRAKGGPIVPLVSSIGDARIVSKAGVIDSLEGEWKVVARRGLSLDVGRTGRIVSVPPITSSTDLEACSLALSLLLKFFKTLAIRFTGPSESIFSLCASPLMEPPKWVNFFLIA